MFPSIYHNVILYNPTFPIWTPVTAAGTLFTIIAYTLTKSKRILLSWPLLEVVCGSITVVGGGHHHCSRQFGHTYSLGFESFPFFRRPSWSCRHGCQRAKSPDATKNDTEQVSKTYPRHKHDGKYPLDSGFGFAATITANKIISTWLEVVTSFGTNQSIFGYLVTVAIFTIRNSAFLLAKDMMSSIHL
ncbi:TPA: hypothetical protein EYN98_00445 [Candidatus Poribacteria bacterium]|nr:hypothetical protein [Candidatus Poribacteria bacterium]HIB92405.1 hypothetical protein [Candidatus Poribacteria bacterium]HIP10627.1 hypothetical protein [Rhodospirillales bacterium]